MLDDKRRYIFFVYRQKLEKLRELMENTFICLEKCKVFNQFVKEDYFNWKQDVGQPFLETFLEYHQLLRENEEWLTEPKLDKVETNQAGFFFTICQNNLKLESS